MKLVIDTQHRENYGAHTWDGKGACPQYWKCKGGETYVVENLTSKQVSKIEAEGIPTLTSLIETYNHGFEEFVIGFKIVADDKVICEEWETPFTLSYEDGKWIAKRFIKADECWQPGYEGKHEQYTMLPKGGRGDYVSEYIQKAA